MIKHFGDVWRMFDYINFTQLFEQTSRSIFSISFPCSLLPLLVFTRFTNFQEFSQFYVKETKNNNNKIQIQFSLIHPNHRIASFLERYQHSIECFVNVLGWKAPFGNGCEVFPRRATSVASIKLGLERRIIGCIDAGQPLPFHPRARMYKSGCESSSRCSLRLARRVSAATRYFTVMFNNSQTARWRESPVSAPPLRLPLPLPSTPFELFRRLISCLVEDVVVAISFASRGAWATSSMKWTTCLSYRIWLTMEWGEGVILLWTLFFSFSFFGGKGEGKGNGRFFKENWRSEAGRRRRLIYLFFILS